jgi:hypothetical protein
MRSIRSKISPGVVLGVIAILIALSGTSIALPGRNSVDSGDIKKNAVRTPDVKNQNLRGADVAPNTLTGADINEGSLGTVPSAGSAQPSGSAGGDLAGSYPNPSVGANKINSANIVNNTLGADDLGANSVAASELGSIVEHVNQGSIVDVVAQNGAWSTSGSITASCLAGEQLLGAAAHFDGTGNNLATQELDTDFTANSVTGQGISDAGGTVNFVVTAICIQ